MSYWSREPYSANEIVRTFLPTEGSASHNCDACSILPGVPFAEKQHLVPQPIPQFQLLLNQFPK